MVPQMVHAPGMWLELKPASFAKANMPPGCPAASSNIALAEPGGGARRAEPEDVI